MSETPPFWRTKTLDRMSRTEWESLCDGCAKCCLIKLEDDDTGEIAYTNVACRLLDLETCRCTEYFNRKLKVPGCVVLTPENLKMLPWMPATCAYRLVHEGKDLPAWHPLVSGRKSTVHDHGISVRGRAVSETAIEEEDLPRFLTDWV